MRVAAASIRRVAAQQLRRAIKTALLCVGFHFATGTGLGVVQWGGYALLAVAFETWAADPFESSRMPRAVSVGAARARYIMRGYHSESLGRRVDSRGLLRFYCTECGKRL